MIYLEKLIILWKIKKVINKLSKNAHDFIINEMSWKKNNSKIY